MALSLLVLLLLLCIWSVCGHKCIHDQINKDSVPVSIQYSNHPMEDSSARSTVDSWKNIRINFVTDKIQNNRIIDALQDVKSAVEQLLYVYPVDGNLLLRRTCLSEWTLGGEVYTPRRCVQFASAKCGEYSGIPDSYFRKEDVYSSDSSDEVVGSVGTGEGVADTDIVVFVTQTSGSCSQSVLAYASNCYRDQFDRPVGAYINVCDIALNQSDEELKAVLVHELFHGLGFSSSDFNRFRKPNGEKYLDPIQTATQRGAQVTKLVVDPAVEKAREHFGCSSVQGIELENTGGGGTAGSHLERRNFNTEHMIGEITENSVVSPLSLAVLESSNWYRVDYKHAERLSWGNKQGCGFAYKEKCLTGSNPDTPFPDHYCTSSGDERCTTDLKGKGECSIYSHSQSGIPSNFQYFSDPNLGGPRLMDYCPYFQPYKSCSSSGSAGVRGETYGSDSMCLQNTLNSGSSSSSEGPGCFQIYCNMTSDSQIESVRVTFSNDEEITCLPGEEGSEKSVAGFTGTVTCPDFAIVCQINPYANDTVSKQGCKFQCRNGGVCQDGECQCVEGEYSGEICESSSSKLIGRVFGMANLLIFLIALIMY